MAAEMVKEFRLRANELGLIQPGPAQPGNLRRHPRRSSPLPPSSRRKPPSQTSAPKSPGCTPTAWQRRIPLQADPSVIYAELLQGTYTGALHHADMQFDSPYNTYHHAGSAPRPHSQSR